MTKRQRANRIKAQNAKAKLEAVRKRQELAARAHAARFELEADADFWTGIALSIFGHCMNREARKIEAEINPLDMPPITETIQ